LRPSAGASTPLAPLRLHVSPFDLPTDLGCLGWYLKDSGFPLHSMDPQVAVIRHFQVRYLRPYDLIYPRPPLSIDQACHLPEGMWCALTAGALREEHRCYHWESALDAHVADRAH